MESWAKILIDGSHRDQLSFDYCCWKHKLKYGHLHEQYRSADSKDFKIVKHDGLKNKLAVVIVNKDTEKLTNAAIRSLRKYVKTRPYDVVVFDNSEKTQYKPDMPNVTVINNTHGDFVDFQKIIKYTSVEKSKNGYASYKHAITVQFLFDSLKYDELVFIDSDVIIKRDFDFMKCGAAIAGDWSENIPARRKRFAPYVMYVNLLKVKKAGIRFLDTDRITGGSNP
jgi:alpha-N-acetylglucosamine transferase